MTSTMPHHCVSGLVNMNQRVRLKLTERGKKMYAESVGRGLPPQLTAQMTKPTITESGVIEIQLWEAFWAFGPAMATPTMDMPFETTFELLELR
jgi:hypothetical protein